MADRDSVNLATDSVNTTKQLRSYWISERLLEGNSTYPLQTSHIYWQ
jgi:hypothetical protein